MFHKNVCVWFHFISAQVRHYPPWDTPSKIKIPCLTNHSPAAVGSFNSNDQTRILRHKDVPHMTNKQKLTILTYVYLDFNYPRPYTSLLVKTPLSLTPLSLSEIKTTFVKCIYYICMYIHYICYNFYRDIKHVVSTLTARSLSTRATSWSRNQTTAMQCNVFLNVNE